MDNQLDISTAPGWLRVFHKIWDRRVAVVVLWLSLCALSGCAVWHRVSRVIFGPSEQPQPPPDPLTMIITSCWWLIPGAIICAAAAGFLIVHGKIKAGLSLGVAAGVALALSVTVFAHFALIGWVILAAGTLLLAYTAYLAYIHRKAIPELVATGEAAKAQMNIPELVAVFGNSDDGDRGLAGIIQSPATEKLVKRERIKLGKARVGTARTLDTAQ